MPAGDCQIRVPVQLGIIVGVQVDTAWGDNQPPGIQHLCGIAGVQTAHFGNLPIFDANVTPVAWYTGAIDNCAIFDNDIILSHKSLLMLGVCIVCV